MGLPIWCQTIEVRQAPAPLAADSPPDAIIPDCTVEACCFTTRVTSNWRGGRGPLRRLIRGGEGLSGGTPVMVMGSLGRGRRRPGGGGRPSNLEREVLSVPINLRGGDLTRRNILPDFIWQGGMRRRNSGRWKALSRGPSQYDMNVSSARVAPTCRLLFCGPVLPFCL